MSTLPSVAVVILNWNGKNFLQQFLPSVISSSYKNLKIIIADNASTDDSVSFIEQNYSSMQIIKNNSNEGFTKGYNTALKQVSADYYVLLNSDVEVTSNWIEPIIELMESDELIAACQPKILSYKNKNEFEYAGACGGWIDNYGYPFSRGRVFDVCEIDAGQYDDAQQIFWATGACLFVKAKVFHEIGGFDEYFFAHQEEIDLCWRMQHAGYKIFVQPASVVYHVGGGTLAMGDKRKTYLNFRNNLVMITKNCFIGDTFWKIPFRISLNKIFALKAFLNGDTKTFVAVVKAHLHYIKWLFAKKNKTVFPKIKRTGLQGVYEGLIVWRYFVKKKKIFSEIVKTKN